MRQLTQIVIDSSLFSNIICMTQYSKTIASKTTVLFEQNNIQNTLVDVLELHGKRHLHIAETEKYAHVTFFFNGGKETQGQFEERILIQSPNVKTYDLQPEMSIYELQERLFAKIEENSQDFIVINIANGDMVGHSGNFEAAKQAAAHIDIFLGNLEKCVLENGYELLITADHGNLEEMVDSKTGEIHTQHTTGVVPLILVSKNPRKLRAGSLANIAGTVLDLMEIPKPSEMVEGLLV
jgi:2,3-bisphosphoglycerate-independent phosphoglycerate mutase